MTSLDVARSWFRYHHLFADLLQLELRTIAPESVAPLHRAAAQWNEEHGNPVEAVRHAQAAHDWPHAARLLAANHIGLILDGRLVDGARAAGGLPLGLGAADPELALVFADVRLRDGAPDDADAYLAAAEEQAATVPAERRDAVRTAAGERQARVRQPPRRPRRAREMRCAALEARSLTQPAGALEQSNDIRALALMSLGITELWALELDDARRHLEEALALARRIGRPYLEIGCLADLGDRGDRSAGCPRPRRLRFTEQAVAVAEAHGLEADPVAALAFAVGAGTLAWLGRFDEARAVAGASAARPTA